VKLGALDVGRDRDRAPRREADDPRRQAMLDDELRQRVGVGELGVNGCEQLGHRGRALDLGCIASQATQQAADRRRAQHAGERTGCVGEQAL
jgi:hypothetical protein